MSSLSKLLENNRRWAAEMTANDPGFFVALSHQQRPKYLWIGCSDSRVPANEIIGLMPGEVFVHRNVGNIVVHTDLNCQSVIQYAVDILHVEDLIVCGHYGCGGVGAVVRNEELGLVDNWLRHIKDVYHRHRAQLEAIADVVERGDRLSEINVAEQAANVCATTVVQNAWRRGQPVTVHGFVYGLRDGLIRDLELRMASAEDIPAVYALPPVTPAR